MKKSHFAVNTFSARSRNIEKSKAQKIHERNNAFRRGSNPIKIPFPFLTGITRAAAGKKARRSIFFPPKRALTHF